jgi:DNA-binding TFAR19-related protein (PDSD5 family)
VNKPRATVIANQLIRQRQLGQLPPTITDQELRKFLIRVSEAEAEDAKKKSAVTFDRRKNMLDNEESSD